MALDVEEWIDEQFKDVEVSDEHKKVLVDALGNEQVAQRIEAATLRQGDYSRKMDTLSKDLKDKQEAAEEARLQAETKYGELAEWEKGEQAKATKMQQHITQLEAKAAQADAALKKAAEETGLDLKELGIDSAAVTKPTDTGIDTEQFVTREQLKNLNSKMVDVFTNYTPDLIQMAANHLVEFGKPLDIKSVVEAARKPANANKSLDQIYEEMYEVPKHRAERVEADIQKRIDAARQEGVEEGIQKVTAPPDSRSPNEIHSPVLRVISKEQKARGGGEMTAVERAVQRTLANRAKRDAA